MVRMKSKRFINNTFLLIALFAIKPYANQIDNDSTIQGPPSGNKQFYTGLGLSRGGLTCSILGIWVLSSVGPDSIEYGPRNIYGVQYSSTEISNHFEIGFGVTLLAAGIGLDVFGIPPLLKGNRLREEKKMWFEKNKISLVAKVHKDFSWIKSYNLLLNNYF
jgi:hypothetical protein